MATILVTGGSGYIGSHTVLELLNKNYDFDKVVEFLKLSLRSQDKAERQAKLLFKHKGDC